MGTLTVITEPTVEPITLSEAKAALRVDHSNDDTLITGYIKTARIFAENYLNMRIVTQVVERSYDAWPGITINLGVYPLQSIDSVKYDDTASPVTEQTLTVNTDYYADTTTAGGRVGTINGWPSVASKFNPIRIRMTAGFATASPETTNIPESIKDGIKLYVKFLYDGDCLMEKAAMSVLEPEQYRCLTAS